MAGQGDLFMGPRPSPFCMAERRRMGRPGDICPGCARHFQPDGRHPPTRQFEPPCEWPGDLSWIPPSQGLALSPEQEGLLAAIEVMPPGSGLVVRGFPGTGKTVALKAAVDRFGEGIAAVVCPTGRAAQNIRKDRIAARTIHSNFLAPDQPDWPHRTDEEAEEAWLRGELDGHDLRWLERDCNLTRGGIVLADEGSMIGPLLVAILRKVTTMYDLRLVIFGDPFQLPPVIKSRDNPGGRIPKFCVLEGDGLAGLDHDRIDLSTIHRQAGDSPIKEAVLRLRSGEDRCGPQRGQHDYVSRPGGWAMAADEAARLLQEGRSPIVLTWTNRAKDLICKRIRSRLGLSGPPVPGEPLMILHTIHHLDLMNGQVVRFGGFETGDAIKISEKHPEVEARWGLVEDDSGRRVRVLIVLNLLGVGPAVRWLKPEHIYRKSFGHVGHAGVSLLLAVAWGYASTAHKVQGSEWDEAIVHVDPKIVEMMGEEFVRRHTYTAISRARRRLLLIHPPDDAGLIDMFGRRK